MEEGARIVSCVRGGDMRDGKEEKLDELEMREEEGKLGLRGGVMI